MQRNVKMEDISDGKLYDSNDLVRADTNQCKGCSACCHGMGTSIVLDPLDVYQICKYTKKSVQELLIKTLELNVVDGIIMPNIAMNGNMEACGFLNSAGRCSIHPARPGICRLFPLGRYYDNNTFKYFLQIHECQNSKTKVKVKKWIDMPNLKDYEDYINVWHNFQKDLQQKISEKSMNENFMKQVSMYLLQKFYLEPFDENMDFYPQFYQRLEIAKKHLL